MGIDIMKGWEKWSLRQWDRWGSKLKPKYAEIKSWETPEWTKKLFAKIWDELDKELKVKLYKIIVETCKQFDDKYAKALIKSIVDTIKKLLKIK